MTKCIFEGEWDSEKKKACDFDTESNADMEVHLFNAHWNDADDASSFIERLVEFHMRSQGVVIKETTATIEQRIWSLPDDLYLVVPEIQVFSDQGFEKGDKVRVTIEKEERP